jgi:hypothetical protein
MTDGLAQLVEKRDQRRRSIPPSRNVARPPAVNAASVEEATKTPAPLPSPADVSPAPVAVPRPIAGLADDLAKFSIYFDAANDEFLEAARIAGRRAKPRVDASRSAVARLAVARLAEQMSAEDVIAELRRRAPVSPGPGRKRL